MAADAEIEAWIMPRTVRSRSVQDAKSHQCTELRRTGSSAYEKDLYCMHSTSMIHSRTWAIGG